jgi:hypothetical protein
MRGPRLSPTIVRRDPPFLRRDGELEARAPVGGADVGHPHVERDVGRERRRDRGVAQVEARVVDVEPLDLEGRGEVER